MMLFFYNSSNVLVKYEVHLNMVIVDVDFLVAENQNRPGTFFFSGQVRQSVWA